MIRGHFKKPYSGAKSIHTEAVLTEKVKCCSYFVEQENLEEKSVESVCSQVFSTLYWLAKEDIAAAKYSSLLKLLESHGLDEIKQFRTSSSAKLREYTSVRSAKRRSCGKGEKVRFVSHLF